MRKPRAIGTLTLGVSLVVFGVFFLINSINYLIPYEHLLTLWPIVLILLGGEVLLSYALNREAKAAFSGVSIFLLVLLTLFALGTGAVGYVLNNSERFIEIMRLI